MLILEVERDNLNLFLKRQGRYSGVNQVRGVQLPSEMKERLIGSSSKINQIVLQAAKTSKQNSGLINRK